MSASKRPPGRLERLARRIRRSPVPTDAARVRTLLSAERFSWARALIYAYYAILFFYAANNIWEWPNYLDSSPTEPRWPVFWLRFFDQGAIDQGVLGQRVGIGIILWFHLLAALLGILAPGFRAIRVIVFLSLLEFLSFKYSFGSINHGDHLSILLAFVLIWLPAGWSSSLRPTRRIRAHTLLVFSGCQALILLTYSMAGLWKVAGALEQLVTGQVNALMPRGLAQHVAAKLLEDDTTSFLGPWFIDHPLAGWPLMIVTLYIQFFAIWVVTRPSLHAAWGIGLIGFHLGTHLLMAVGFPNNTLWLALFLVFSPFRPGRFSLGELATELPLIGRHLVARRLEVAPESG